jgi:hypothetical protein
MYSGASGNRMRDSPPSVRSPANRLNRKKNADWLPLVSPTLPAVTGQLNSFHSASATASRNPRSPSGAEYPAMNRPNWAGSAAISMSRRR